MSDHKAKSRSRAAILAADPRCIYCHQPATSVEHMPPRGMFRDRSRPSGMEYPCCDSCNNGTSAADLVAGFMARINPTPETEAWKRTEMVSRRRVLERIAPGLIDEVFDLRKGKQVFVPTKGGVLQPMVGMKSDGPLLTAYLNVFAAKFGMALYREHCGAPLPLTGSVSSVAFLNSGLPADVAAVIVSIMPIGGTLRQGKISAEGQFYYRYNTDDCSIVGSLAKFHNGLSVCSFAYADTEIFGPALTAPLFRTFKPGDLTSMMP